MHLHVLKTLLACWCVINHMDNPQLTKAFKEISIALTNIDISLQLLSADKQRRTTAFVSKKAVAQRLGVPSVTVDKLIYQGISSRGSSGLVEGKHYTKLDPSENNPAKFLYDVHEILQAAWSNFKYD
jgi:hypothetical protein